jgi:hypothetical protein
MADAESAKHTWRFFRAGGFDQVRLDRGSDLVNLRSLDQKLWVALSCPTRGIEFDPRTLDLIDTDKDGRVRANELLAAVDWAVRMVKDPDVFLAGSATLPLAAINDATEEGKTLLASAKQILFNLGRPDADQITPDDTADTQKIFAATRFNGDGIVPPDAADDPETKAALTDIMTCLGGDMDRNGCLGITRARVEKFFADAAALTAWAAGADGADALRPLGADTEAAAAAFSAVAAKIDDFFIRCRLAEYDSRAGSVMNRSEADLAALAAQDLAAAQDALAAFPVAATGAGRPLPLEAGVNPAWAGRLATFRAAVLRPLLGDAASLTEAQWEEIKTRFAAYHTWMAGKPATPVEALGLPRLREVGTGEMRKRIDALIDRDLALEPEANAIASVNRLALYHRDLHKLLVNFVSFRDFYTRRSKATFQAGSLYLDGRSADLCVKVEDIAKHAALATLGRMYLVYCECRRKESPGVMNIAAAFTAGDSDQLLVGRNGVFYDRAGRDWDATIVKIVEHPISIRQAFWLPYRKAAKLIGEQIEKFAAARSKVVDDTVNKTVTTVTSAPAAPPPAPGKEPPPAFDAAKFAGIFAAIGLAVGALGTALASIVTGFIGLSWWQMPLAVLGIILLFSGPSVVIAYMKLRQRNLGPILDANGWAVNARARINIPFGTALTSLARLPEGSERALTDPYAEKETPWALYIALVVIVAALVAAWRFGLFQRLLS